VGIDLSLSGNSLGGTPYTAAWPNPNTTPPGVLPINLTSNFGYSATCFGSNSLPALFGNAGGTFTVGGGMLAYNGTIWNNATLSGTWVWQELGPDEAGLSLIGTSITGAAGPSQVAVTFSLNSNIVGEGAVFFTSTSPGLATCQNQQSSQTDAIGGALAQPT